MASDNNNFAMSRRSRLGALALIVIIFILIIIWRLLPLMVQSPPANDLALQKSWEEFKATQLIRTDSSVNETYSHSGQAAASRAPDAPLFVFDPNTATEEELLRLGLPKHTVRTMLKYRSKGGHFYKVEDLKKLYTLSEKDYSRIAAYVHIEGREQANTEFRYQKDVQPASSAGIIELNTADADLLMSLKGIGPAFAKRIIKFRNALGGFLSVEQLKEVYGFPDSTYRQVERQLKADVNKVRLLNINTATEQDLGKHPYIGKKLAAGIIQLREGLQSFKSKEDLRQVPLINEEKYRKIAPYLSTH